MFYLLEVDVFIIIYLNMLLHFNYDFRCSSDTNHGVCSMWALLSICLYKECVTYTHTFSK